MLSLAYKQVFKHVFIVEWGGVGVGGACSGPGIPYIMRPKKCRMFCVSGRFRGRVRVRGWFVQYKNHYTYGMST